MARTPLLTVGSQRAYELATSSLADCIKNHTSCPKPDPGTILPTRVIDCKHLSRPKLLLSRGITAPYTALSYVWGEGQKYRTQTTNVKRYMTCGINVCVLGQTIRDAIEVTRRLGLRYLWVDALCIIQDSDEDKANELVKMRSIYRDAYLTIIASSAPRASAGFLHTHTLAAEYAEHPRLPFYTRDGRVGSMFAYSQDGPAMVYDPMKEPVNTRAWCLQERLLSPRKLVYASDTLQYHCQTAMADVGDSISGKPIGEQLHDVMFQATDKADIAARLSKWTSSDWQGLHELWRMVVSNYTRRSLTEQGDKLHAFAGVAEEFDRIWGEYAGRYIAGVWEKLLPDDLLWHHDPLPWSETSSATALTLRARLDRSFAPSWSWASVDGHVLPDDTPWDEHGNEDCEVVQCNVALKETRLSYGHIAAASLQLRAVALRTPWLVFPESGNASYLSLYRPTDLLRSRGATASQMCKEASIVVGTTTDMDDEDEVGQTHEVGLEATRVHEGLLAFDSAMEADSTLLFFMGDISIFFDSSERVPAGQVYAVVIKRFQVDDDPGAKGLLVVDAGSRKYKRIAYWISFMQRARREDKERRDVEPAWFDCEELGSSRRILELV